MTFPEVVAVLGLQYLAVGAVMARRWWLKVQAQDEANARLARRRPLTGELRPYREDDVDTAVAIVLAWPVFVWLAFLRWWVAPPIEHPDVRVRTFLRAIWSALTEPW